MERCSDTCGKIFRYIWLDIQVHVVRYSGTCSKIFRQPRFLTCNPSSKVSEIPYLSFD